MLKGSLIYTTATGITNPERNLQPIIRTAHGASHRLTFPVPALIPTGSCISASEHFPDVLWISRLRQASLYQCMLPEHRTSKPWTHACTCIQVRCILMNSG